MGVSLVVTGHMKPYRKNIKMLLMYLYLKEVI
ncbi:hypothetical protein CoNPh34_CDS0029 [Staphylococcus phage S-CoN_Ph34]|nr:hypothetical protein CoNPh34_CDS0029 [Staphylococcus phage S-CoN_Ph34]WNM55662.1 hypothetical protein CoNPh36_CDS0020 [Staphylococcus phage S-CoN_Ph36]